MKILKKLFPLLGILYFAVAGYGQTRGVSYDLTATNVIQTVHQKFHSITNLAATASTIAGYDANKKLGTLTAAQVRTIIEVPIFDSSDPGAVNIFPFWDDTQNEVDWTSNTALRTLLGIDSNDAVTFGAVTGDSFTAGSTNMVGALALKAPLANPVFTSSLQLPNGATPTTDATGEIAVDTTITDHGAMLQYFSGSTEYLAIAIPRANLDNTDGDVVKYDAATDRFVLSPDNNSGGGSAPVGTMVNTGASTQYALPRYSDTTGTNIAPSSLLTDATGTNFYAGGFLINDLTVTNPIPFTSGGFGIATGTSGGIPYFSSSTNVASSAALAANAIVLGGGAGAAPATTTTGAGVVTALGIAPNASGGMMTIGGVKADVLEAPLFAADAGANDTYVATLSPAITAYVTGAHYRFKANTANTGAATINLNSLGAKTIKKVAGGITTDLADNDIRAGQWVDLVYDGTNMQMQSLLGNAPAGSGTVTSVGWTGGIVSVATATTTPAFTIAGTSGGIPYFSSSSAWASSAALAANAIVIGGGAGVAPSTTTTGTGILTWLGTPSSANLKTAITDETGNGGSAVFSQNPQITRTTSPQGADDTYAGVSFTGLNNSGGVTQWDVVYLNGSSQWVLADANGSGTYPARGITVATVATANATTVLEEGVIRNDAWTWTPGGTIYLSTTAGGLTQTAPSTTGDKVQVIGYAIDADTMRVRISPDYGTAP